MRNMTLKYNISRVSFNYNSLCIQIDLFFVKTVCVIPHAADILDYLGQITL
jgi:hypothetical protein